MEQPEHHRLKPWVVLLVAVLVIVGDLLVREWFAFVCGVGENADGTLLELCQGKRPDLERLPLIGAGVTFVSAGLAWWFDSPWLLGFGAVLGVGAGFALLHAV